MEEKLTFLKAIHDGLREEMLRDERVFIMGERVRDTPISEAGFVGAAAGAAMTGMRPVVDMLIAPFMYCAMDQIVSIIAKSTYLYGGQTAMPVTIRAAMFYGNSSAAQHSDRPMATFMTIPGLKIVAPSTPSDAKGLLKAAIREDDPVLYFDDASLWTSIERVEKTEDADVIVPLGKAAIRREGTDVTLVAVSGSNRPALAAADMLADEGISVEVIDPRSLVPLDSETILASVAKTGRAVLVDPTHRTLSVSSEIASIIAEEGFWSLQAPVIRVTAPSTHVPFSPPLEAGLFPNADRIAAAVRKVME
jgi:pyruvate/2-oxoglutarate/acetoin dehydrogenase E1 component